MPTIKHLIPYDGIGGVETAARSMSRVSTGALEFEVEFIFENVSIEGRKLATYDLRALVRAAWRLSRSDVDVLVVSLWRSALVGLLASLLRPRMTLVVFVHSSNDTHFFDRTFTRLAVRRATEIWADSETTLRSRLPGVDRRKCRIISFVTRRFHPLPERSLAPSFIFWGRIAREKGLSRALRIFAGVRERAPDARFVIVGPDGGDVPPLQALRASLGLGDAVVFSGFATHEQIVALARGASFYLQTSVYEGMAMSVVEAMQLGLVPVVTPVGEIGLYCRHQHNALIVDTDERAIEDVLEVLGSEDRYRSLRSNAVATWRERPLYRESVLRACEALLERSASSR